MIRILLAEDDDAMRGYLSRALERNGYHVTTAASGTEALQFVESGTFDLLLTDIVMPGMDGIELAKRAAAEQGIAVVAVAGLDDLLAFTGERAEFVGQRDALLAYRARYGIA
mgnify:CR=1 FL=1